MIQRELKREKLAAKYAAKVCRTEGNRRDVKRSDEERDAARLGLQTARNSAHSPA